MNNDEKTMLRALYLLGPRVDELSEVASQIGAVGRVDGMVGIPVSSFMAMFVVSTYFAREYAERIGEEEFNAKMREMRAEIIGKGDAKKMAEDLLEKAAQVGSKYNLMASNMSGEEFCVSPSIEGEFKAMQMAQEERLKHPEWDRVWLETVRW